MSAKKLRLSAFLPYQLSITSNAVSDLIARAYRGKFALKVPEWRVMAVLGRGEERPRVDYRLDGEGRVMLPGMIDAHVHVMDMGFAALTLDLSETKSLAEAQANIAAYVAEARAAANRSGVDASPRPILMIGQLRPNRMMLAASCSHAIRGICLVILSGAKDPSLRSG